MKPHSKRLCDFLKSHPFISLNALEKELKMPQGTLWKAMNDKRNIPVRYIFPMIYILADYGLTWNGYTLTQDPETYNVLAHMRDSLIDVREDDSSFEYIVKEFRYIISDYSDL